MSNVMVKGSGTIVFAAYKEIRSDLGINTYFIKSCNEKEKCSTFTLKEFVDPKSNALKAKETKWEFEGTLQQNRYKKNDEWQDGGTEVIIDSAKWCKIKS